MKPTSPARQIFGGFDGTASLLGVIIYLLLAHPALIFPTPPQVRVSAAISMGGGQFLSDSDTGFAASGVMARPRSPGLSSRPCRSRSRLRVRSDRRSAVLIVCIGATVVADAPQPGAFPRLRLRRSILLAAVAAVVVACALTFRRECRSEPASAFRVH